ncbi:Intraflagellar transport protein 22 [Clydaea vesicula]|uniref:Intraflagellar transport protein 22 n=1 Tax=Clydaea vesicula TaxID=447962 RepID=A0AAD5U5A4_9FUNG|nr:Intraflagellar transport protein 22 [Clydaea vesicula]KAJ3393486.1 Intraflagellar transport protein 22 [Lobulomyces angularis]
MINKITTFIVGPSKVGKSFISSSLADVSESLSSEYHPTQGVRILEFERKIKQKNKEVPVSIELWDCSGDLKFQPVWSSVSNSANAVLYVFSPDSKQEKELDLWYENFSFLKDTQFAVFGNTINGSVKKSTPKFGSDLNKVTPVFTSNNDPNLIKAEFDKLINKAYLAWVDNREKEEQSMLN